MTQRCELCRYYVEAKSACHRLPPVLYYDKPNNVDRFVFHAVMKQDWCGEFIDKGALPS